MWSSYLRQSLSWNIRHFSHLFSLENGSLFTYPTLNWQTLKIIIYALLMSLINHVPDVSFSSPWSILGGYTYSLDSPMKPFNFRLQQWYTWRRLYSSAEPFSLSCCSLLSLNFSETSIPSLNFLWNSRSNSALMIISSLPAIAWDYISLALISDKTERFRSEIN